MKYLIDTNICVYIINSRFEGSKNWITNVGLDNVFISAITVAELEYGISKSNRQEETQQALYKFLSGFNILDFDLSCSQAYGKIRYELQKKGSPIGNMDMLIAATAKAKDMTIVTNNMREFSRIDSLVCENWVESPP